MPASDLSVLVTLPARLLNIAVRCGLDRDVALGYLANPKFAAYEVSFLVGYTEPATFFRAFKRWTGKTPQQYRASAS